MSDMEKSSNEVECETMYAVDENDRECVQQRAAVLLQVAVEEQCVGRKRRRADDAPVRKDRRICEFRACAMPCADLCDGAPREIRLLCAHARGAKCVLRVDYIRDRKRMATKHISANPVITDSFPGHDTLSDVDVVAFRINKRNDILTFDAVATHGERPSDMPAIFETTVRKVHNRVDFILEIGGRAMCEFSVALRGGSTLEWTERPVAAHVFFGTSESMPFDNAAYERLRTVRLNVPDRRKVLWGE